MTEHLEGPVGTGRGAEIGRTDTGRHQHDMAVGGHAETAGQGFELAGFGKQADYVVAADAPSVLQVIGMDRGRDMALEIGVVAAAVDLVAKIDQDNVFIVEITRQPVDIDKRCRSGGGGSGCHEEQQRGQRPGKGAAEKMCHPGLHETAPAGGAAVDASTDLGNISQ